MGSMGRFKLRWSLALMAGVAMIAVTANAGPIDIVRGLAHSSSANSATPAAATSSPLGKFTATGRVNETLNTGPCPGSIATTACSTPSDCDQLQITGPVVATAVGKANLSACLTFDDSTIQTGNNTLGICFIGIGEGTLTANKGDTVPLVFSGEFCVANEFPLPTPTTAVFEMNTAYSISGGVTGRFADAVGNGNLTASSEFDNIAAGSPPFSGTGTLNMVGSFAKK